MGKGRIPAMGKGRIPAMGKGRITAYRTQLVILSVRRVLPHRRSVLPYTGLWYTVPQCQRALLALRPALALRIRY